MATVIRREVRKRGFFGWVFLILFLLFNVLMGFWVYNIVALGAGTEGATEAERAGTAIGAGIAVSMVLFVWAAGSIVTGLLALLTRGSKTIIEEVQ